MTNCVKNPARDGNTPDLKVNDKQLQTDNYLSIMSDEKQSHGVSTAIPTWSNLMTKIWRNKFIVIASKFIQKGSAAEQSTKHPSHFDIYQYKVHIIN